MKATKQQLCAALRAFINQRSGIDFRNYQSCDWKASREAFNGDYRPIIKRGKQAREMLRAVELRDSITAENLVSACRAYSGRLQFTETENGVRVDYCTGQYFPTEYRAAACAVLAQCLWDYFGGCFSPDGKESRRVGSGTFSHEIECETMRGMTAGEYIRKQAKNEFGRGIARDWFN